MNILITGGNGYIAKSIHAIFSSVYDVTLITRKDVDLSCSQEVSNWFSGKYFDVVIHCAISGGSRLKNDFYDVLDNNLRMYYNLLDNRNHFDKFINIGSGAELHMFTSPYGLSKLVIRNSILEKDNFYNIRVFGVFDEHELDTRFIKANLLRYIKKEPMQIFQNKKMDFFYMKDFVQFVQQYVEQNNFPKEINCNYERAYYLSEITDFINTLGEYRVNVNIQSEYVDVDYCGSYKYINIPTEGLFNGIQSVYEKLLCKK